MPPSARMVTPLAPVNVVNSAQTNVAMTASPPGIHPKQPCAARTSRREAPPSASTYPATVSSGIAGRVGETTRRKVSAGTEATGVAAR